MRTFEIPVSPFSRVSLNKVALIDADRYKHVVPYEVSQRLQAGETWSQELLDECIEQKLEKDIFGAFKVPVYLFCFSAPSKNVFRNWIAEEKQYKGNRKNRLDKNDYPNKFQDMAYVYDYIRMRYPTMFFDDLEADDILSMIQHPSETFIFSHDKDLKQVRGFHWDMKLRVLTYTDEEEGLRRLLCQMITGDTVDNIPGIIGSGEKALHTFLDEIDGLSEMDSLLVCLKYYVEKYGILDGANSFAEQWMLLSMKSARGTWTKEKYSTAFKTVEELLKNLKK